MQTWGHNPEALGRALNISASGGALRAAGGEQRALAAALLAREAEQAGTERRAAAWEAAAPDALAEASASQKKVRSCGELIYVIWQPARA